MHIHPIHKGVGPLSERFVEHEHPAETELHGHIDGEFRPVTERGDLFRSYRRIAKAQEVLGPQLKEAADA